MSVEAAFLQHPDVQTVLSIFGNDPAYFVGGCVRNLLLGAAISDLDISTPLHPAEVIERAEAANLRAVPTGIDHGTVTVIAGDTAFEITTFRKDVETDGRRAVVAFAETMEQDAERRDFTMNALYLDADGQVHDPVGGLPDLTERHFRFIGQAEDRIREDALRILRFFRFHAWYGAGALNAEGLTACADHVGLIDTLSRERVGAEFKRLIAAPDPMPVLVEMEQIGALSSVLPGADLAAFARGLQSDVEGDAVYRLALLRAHDAGPALRLSRAEVRRLETMTQAAQGTDMPHELGYRLGQADALAALNLRAAFADQDTKPAEIQDISLGAAADFPLLAKDLKQHLSGPALGAALKSAEAAWVDARFDMTKPDLIAWALRDAD
ncbi:MAG: CCA tRNA nucleotidyltransferase [Pseudomonadota bacterium]